MNGEGRGELSDFQIEKFPVISEAGNEYLVKVNPARYSYGVVEISVYKTVEKRGLFGGTKIKYVAINEDVFGEGTYYPEMGEWNYDYRAMAINEIIGYENSVKERIKHEEDRMAAVRAFEEWNGKE